MPNSTATSKTILQYQVDQNGVAQVLSANAKVTASVQGANDALGSIGKFSGAQVVVKQLDAATVSANRLRDALKDASSSAAFADPTAAGGGGLLGALENAQNTGLGRVGSQLRTLPSVQIPGAGIGTDAVANLLRAGGALEALGVSAGALAAVVSVGIPVVLGIVAAVNLYNSAIDEYSKKVEAFADALNTAFGAGTTKAIEALRDKAEADREAARNTYNDLVTKSNAAPTQLQQTADNFSKSLENVERSLLGLPQIALDTRPTVESYTDAIAEQKKKYDDAGIAIDAYNAALGTQATAAADTANAIDQISNAQLDAAKFAATATTESVKKRLDADQLERQYLEAESAVLAAQHTAEADKIKAEVDARILLLNIQDSAIQGFKDEIAARETANELQKSQTAAGKASADALNKEIEDRKKAQQALDDLTAQHNRTVDEAYANAADAETKAFNDRTVKLADAQDKADKDLADAQDKADKDALKEQQKYNDDKAKIDRTYARDSATAIQNRDAVALDAAKTKRKDDLDDLKKAYAKQKKEISDALKEQQQTIRDRLKDTQSDIEKAYNKQVQAAELALEKAVIIENQKYELERKVRQATLDYAVAQYKQFFDQLRGVSSGTIYTGNGNSYTPNVATGVNYTQLNGDAFAKWAHDNGIPGYASGGMVNRTGLIYAHRGERVLTVQQQRSYGGITINGYGMNEQQVIGQVRKALRAYNRGLKAA